MKNQFAIAVVIEGKKKSIFYGKTEAINNQLTGHEAPKVYYYGSAEELVENLNVLIKTRGYKQAKVRNIHLKESLSAYAILYLNDGKKREVIYGDAQTVHKVMIQSKVYHACAYMYHTREQMLHQIVFERSEGKHCEEVATEVAVPA